MTVVPYRRPPAPTIRDVAVRAGVAAATVSNVLTKNRVVSAETRSSVLAAIEALGFRPNQMAASLRRRRSRTIGIVVPDMSNAFFISLVRPLEEMAAAAGYQILLVDANESASHEAARVRALLDHMVDGLIMAPTRDNLAAHESILDRLPPTVLIDRGVGYGEFDTVSSDNAGAAYLGCRHLLELGHRNIAVVASSRDLANNRERVDGFLRAMQEAGCSQQRVMFGGLSVELCRAVVEQELRRADRPTALFAVTQPATLGAIKAVRALDLAFPDDVSLLGFDDCDWMTVLRPYVSTVVQSTDAMAAEAWRLLNARLTGGSTGPARIQLPCTLRVRESTRPVSEVMRRPRPGSRL